MSLLLCIWVRTRRLLFSTNQLWALFACRPLQVAGQSPPPTPWRFSSGEILLVDTKICFPTSSIESSIPFGRWIFPKKRRGSRAGLGSRCSPFISSSNLTMSRLKEKNLAPSCGPGTSLYYATFHEKKQFFPSDQQAYGRDFQQRYDEEFLHHWNKGLQIGEDSETTLSSSSDTLFSSRVNRHLPQLSPIREQEKDQEHLSDIEVITAIEKNCDRSSASLTPWRPSLITKRFVNHCIPKRIFPSSSTRRNFSPSSRTTRSSSFKGTRVRANPLRFLNTFSTITSSGTNNDPNWLAFSIVPRAVFFSRSKILSKTLQDYTHIILDEVHERDQPMDFLLVLIRTLWLRNSPNVKILLMSATMEVEKLAKYFRQVQQGESRPTHQFFVGDRLFDVQEMYLEHI